MFGVILLALMLYGALALGFRWGKQVGAGAERYAFRQHAARNGGVVLMPESLVNADRFSGPGV